MATEHWRHGFPRRVATCWAGAVLACAVTVLAASPTPAETGDGLGPRWEAGSEGIVLGFGAGFGSQYATMGFRGFIGTDYLTAEAAFGTEPFVWRPTYAVGGSALLLNPRSPIRPKLSVLLKSNASAVAVFEPEQEGKIQKAVEYEPVPGLAWLAGAEIFPFRGDPGSVEVSVGWRIPFGGMAKVEEKANVLLDRYGPTGHEVATPRLDHLSFSLGLNYRWGGE